VPPDVTLVTVKTSQEAASKKLTAETA